MSVWTVNLESIPYTLFCEAATRNIKPVATFPNPTQANRSPDKRYISTVTALYRALSFGFEHSTRVSPSQSYNHVYKLWTVLVLRLYECSFLCIICRRILHLQYLERLEHWQSRNHPKLWFTRMLLREMSWLKVARILEGVPNRQLFSQVPCGYLQLRICNLDSTIILAHVEKKIT